MSPTTRDGSADLLKTMSILDFWTVVLEAEIELLQLERQTVLRWIGLDFLGRDQSAVEHEGVSDAETS